MSLNIPQTNKITIIYLEIVIKRLAILANWKYIIIKTEIRPMIPIYFNFDGFLFFIIFSFSDFSIFCSLFSFLIISLQSIASFTIYSIQQNGHTEISILLLICSSALQCGQYPSINFMKNPFYTFYIIIMLRYKKIELKILTE